MPATCKGFLATFSNLSIICVLKMAVITTIITTRKSLINIDFLKPCEIILMMCF